MVRRRRTRPEHGGRACRGGRLRAGGAFSLLELLVVVTIIAVLAGVLLAVLAQVRGATRNFMCKNKLKTVSFEFYQFANEFSSPDRGDSEAYRGKGFFIDDFQERLYGIAEFWKTAGGAKHEYDAQALTLLCPSGKRELRKESGVPCKGKAVTPIENVSVGINMRLDRASKRIGTRDVLVPVLLTQRLLEHPSVPLAFDVDGEEATSRDVLPYYSAPPTGEGGVYDSGLFWFPDTRHGRQVNACFVGGYVLTSRTPQSQGGWDWRYQPPP